MSFAAEPYLSEEQIKQKVSELAKKISYDYEGKELLVICVLKGAFIFAADLVRMLEVPCEIDFMRVSSYGNGRTSSGKIDLLIGLKNDITGKDILIVEDILDTGITLSRLCEKLKEQNPASLRTCVLVDKHLSRVEPFEADYSGFRIDSEFVVGYGLDCAEKYRNIPYIAII